MSARDLMDTMRSRTSVTKYTSEELDRNTIGKILEAARWAPSAGNMQSWEFIVVEDYDIKQRLAQYAYNQDHVREAPISVVVLGDKGKADSKYGDRGKDLYMVQETAAAMQNMMLMAEELGLGSAWVGAFEEEEVEDLLNIPAELRAVSIITFGYPRERPEPANKYRVTDVTYLNQYGSRLHAIYDKIVWHGVKEYTRKAKNALKEKFK